MPDQTKKMKIWAVTSMLLCGIMLRLVPPSHVREKGIGQKLRAMNERCAIYDCVRTKKGVLRPVTFGSKTLYSLVKSRPEVWGARGQEGVKSIKWELTSYVSSNCQYNLHFAQGRRDTASTNQVRHPVRKCLMFMGQAHHLSSRHSTYTNAEYYKHI